MHRKNANAIILLIAYLLGSPVVTNAARMPRYDLDSLAYLSSDIVDAKLVRDYREEDTDLVEIEILGVYRGKLKAKQSIAIHKLYSYRKPIADPFNSNRLEAGDRLILFLQSTDLKTERLPSDTSAYSAVISGVRIVHNDKVMDFHHPGSWKPAVISNKAAALEKEATDLEQFDKLIAESIKTAESFEQRLEALNSNENAISELLQLLRERSGNKLPWMRDHIGELICSRLANSHDVAALSQALQLALPYDCQSILSHGFGTAQGRDFLLANIADHQEPMERRIANAHRLLNVGADYHSRFTNIKAHSWTPVRTAVEDNADYITNIAQVTLDSEPHEALCLALLRSLDYFARYIAQENSAHLRTDLANALKVLGKLHSTTKSERIKYQVEVTTAHADRETYDKLASKCGPILSLVTLGDPTRYSQPTERSLIIEVAIVVLEDSTEVEPFVVFVEQTTGKTWLQPVPKLLNRIKKHASFGMSHTVTLPKDLPAGKYRVHLQFNQSDRVVSSGHSCEARL